MKNTPKIEPGIRFMFRITARALLLALAFIASAYNAYAACTTTAAVMTCTPSTTADTVDSTGLPANAASLRDAIIQINSVAPPPAGQTHIINLPASFIGTSFKVTVFKFLPPIWNDVTINGNGNTIEGNNVAITGTGFDTRLFIVGSNGDVTGQPYFAAGSRVKFVLNDMTLKNGVARGGTGGGGGMGAGGAIFITGNGDVTARNVRFEANGAVGGDGGPNATVRGGGGMGGSTLDYGGGGWGGDGNGAGGGIAGIGGVGERAGGGGLSSNIVGNSTTIRGVTIASAGYGKSTIGAPSGGEYGGGGGGSSGNPSVGSGVSGRLTGMGGGTGGSASAVLGGGGGGAGGTAVAVSGNLALGGAGGFGGGGGGYVGGVGGFGAGGGFRAIGGFGGGSGSGASASAFGAGAASKFAGENAASGGFGGGGGGGRSSTLVPVVSGAVSAFAGGRGGDASQAGDIGGNGGGAGLGGAVFVHVGGSLTLAGNSRTTQNFANGGAGSAGITSGVAGADGKACGQGIFVHGDQNIEIDTVANETVVLEDQVADNDCAGTVSPAPFGPGGVAKRGVGALHLVGSQTFSRGADVQAGTLRLLTGNETAFPRIALSGANARLEGDGSHLIGEIVSEQGAFLSPGISLLTQPHAHARMRVSAITFAPSGTRLEINLGGTTPATQYSQLIVDDTATLTFNAVIFSLKVTPGYTPTVGDSFIIIDYGNATTSGHFAGLPENGTLSVNGVTYRINYGNGAVRLTVTAAPSITAGVSLSSNLNPATTVQVVGLTATVSAMSGGTPTGNVLFRDGTTTIAGCEARPLISGVATCNTTFKPAGARTITAVYLGSATHTAATSTTLNQTVNKAVVAISMGSNSNPALTNAPLLFTATINRNDAAGTLSFRADGAPIAGCSQRPLTNNPTNSTATCSTTFASVGSYAITAVYPGDVNYNAGGSTALTQNVIVLSAPGALGALSSVKSAPNGIGQITYSFSAPLSDGGSPITGYTARCTNTITNHVVSVTELATSLTLSPLAVGQPYSCTIFASNAIGDGPVASGTEIVFAPLNIDGSTATIYDAATDGVMILRYLAGIRGDSISDGVVGATGTRTPAQIATYLNSIRTQLDIDGDGVLSPATDGLLIVRFMRGLATSASYINGAFNPSGIRANEDDISFRLGQMMP
jgi:hypothetical protein